MLSGRGFLPTEADVKAIRSHKEDGILRRFLSGKDVTGHDRHRLIIDPSALSEKSLRSEFPVAYDILLRSVYPERKTKRDTAFRQRWWAFGRNRSDLREAVSEMDRYIVVPETSVHRLFQFVSSDVLPEHRLVCIALREGFHLGVLLSRIHVQWSLRTGGTLEDRPTYTKTRCFDPFPFPDPAPEQRAAIADLGEELDATRKAALAEHPRLTMTRLYNLVEKLRAGATLTEAEEADARDARARIVLHLHDQIDAAVAAAYGWPADLSPAEIVTRLVALNAERAVEEAAGHIRWLRPDYQIERFGKADAQAEPSSAGEGDGDAGDDDIHADPEIMGGEPVFRGTRIPVHAIASMMADGADEAEMLTGYPSLTPALLRLAQRWAGQKPSVPRQHRGDNFKPKLVSSRTYPRRRRPDGAAGTGR